MASMIVKFGEKEQYQVEFRLNGQDQIEGRYLDPITPWEVRDVTESRDAKQAAVLDAIHEVLTQFRGERVWHFQLNNRRLVAVHHANSPEAAEAAVENTFGPCDFIDEDKNPVELFYQDGDKALDARDGNWYDARDGVPHEAL